MKIIFLTMTDIPDLDCRYIYTELLKVFIEKGHSVVIISPSDKIDRKYEITEHKDYKPIKIQLLKGADVSLIKKGINTVLLEKWYINAIKKFLKNETFDLVLYSTPPITLCRAVKYIKNKSRAISYLMLKDIFPQNALDLEMMTDRGLKGIMYRYFRRKEKKLYEISNYIGCMSEANINYLCEHNPEIPESKVGLCVNSVIPAPLCNIDKAALRKEFNLPADKKIFFYGGNFGKPQGIDFLVRVLKANMNFKDRYFVLCGKGSEFSCVQKFVNTYKPDNVRLINGLPKDEYDGLLKLCDVGMLFLDSKFTIPNFPSRILPYMEYAIPILSVTDKATDVGKIIVSGDFGWSCSSSDLEECNSVIESICRADDLKEKGNNARAYLEQYYTAEITYKQITEQIKWAD